MITIVLKKLDFIATSYLDAATIIAAIFV